MWLNSDQQEIAGKTNGVCAVFAGAGSGKTATLVARVKNLIESGVPPEKIIVCTFTRKAADEIKARIDNDSVLCDTMHSIALRWIRLAPELAGWKYGIKCVLTEMEAKTISEGRKNARSAMIEAMAIGFDEIISTANHMLSIDPSAIIEEGSHLIVDESQDNSSEQWELVRRIAASGQCDSVMTTGDFRQSIYQWRSASPEDGLAFCNEPGVEQLHLSTNYRSAPEIVDLANRVAALGGFESPMVSGANDVRGDVRFERVPYVPAYIAKHIDDLASEFVPYTEMAVLCRYNREADAIASYMDGEGIPISRAASINKESLERFCSWANWMANPHSVASMKVFLAKLLSTQTISSLASNTLRYMCDPRNELRGMIHRGGAYKRVAAALATGDELTEQEGREAWDMCGGSEEEWREFIKPLVGINLSELSETLNIDCKSPRIKRTGVAVTTAHGAKGLEWPHVFVVGANQKQMPGAKKGWRREEELRILYVEITRAISNLHIVIEDTEQFSEFIADEHGRPIL